MKKPHVQKKSNCASCQSVKPDGIHKEDAISSETTCAGISWLAKKIVKKSHAWRSKKVKKLNITAILPQQTCQNLLHFFRFTSS